MISKEIKSWCNHCLQQPNFKAIRVRQPRNDDISKGPGVTGVIIPKEESIEAGLIDAPGAKDDKTVTENDSFYGEIIKPEEGN